MVKISGAVLDFDKTTGDDWTLYFFPGVFSGENVSREIAARTMKITNEYEQGIAYNIYYDPYINKYSIPESLNNVAIPLNYCNGYGYHLGGFMINNCTLRFMYPTDECVEYVRPFSDEHASGYEHEEIIYESCLIGIAFNDDYNTDFKVFV